MSEGCRLRANVLTHPFSPSVTLLHPASPCVILCHPEGNPLDVIPAKAGIQDLRNPVFQGVTGQGNTSSPYFRLHASGNLIFQW